MVTKTGNLTGELRGGFRKFVEISSTSLLLGARTPTRLSLPSCFCIFFHINANVALSASRYLSERNWTSAPLSGEYADPERTAFANFRISTRSQRWFTFGKDTRWMFFHASNSDNRCSVAACNDE